MPLPDSFLQELVSRNNIEDVVSSYVRTKRPGTYLCGSLPLSRGEKRPPSPSIRKPNPSTASAAERAET